MLLGTLCVRQNLLSGKKCYRDGGRWIFVIMLPIASTFKYKCILKTKTYSMEFSVELTYMKIEK